MAPPPLTGFPRPTDTTTEDSWHDQLVSSFAILKLHCAASSLSDIEASRNDTSLHRFLSEAVEAAAARETKDTRDSEATEDGQDSKRQPAPRFIRTPATNDMFKSILLMTRRLWETSPPEALIQLDFLSRFALVFGKKSEDPLARLFISSSVIQKLIREEKKLLTSSLFEISSSSPGKAQPQNTAAIDDVLSRLRLRIHLINRSPPTAQTLLTGTDFLDALVAGYTLQNTPLRQVIASTTYVCLVGLARGGSTYARMLSDQLYALREAGESLGAGPLGGEDSLVVGLASETPLLRDLKTEAKNSGIFGNALKGRLEALAKFSRGTVKAPARKRKKDKGKKMELPERAFYDTDAIKEMQKMIPGLGSKFVARLLDEYGWSIQLAINHFLENTLPPHLQDADQTEELDAPQPSSLPERRNVFDDDEFDRLTVDKAKLFMGKRDAQQQQTAEDLLDDKASAPSKASIHAALDVLEAEEDDRDDTYDDGDVGASVDAAAAAANKNQEGRNGVAQSDASDEVLYRAWRRDSAVFARTAEARTGSERARLRRDTGLSDEQIEGWAVGVERNPAEVRRLEGRFGVERVVQNELASTSWRPGEEESVEGVSGRGRGSGRGGGGGRARGGGRGRGGGDVAARGPEGEAARRRKEQNKRGRANHNRRDRRAMKTGL